MSGKNSLHSMKRAGLLNIDSVDIRDMQEVKRRRVPYCTSEACTRFIDLNGKFKFKPKVEKKTNSSTCPDCGFALVWRTEEAE